jgi:hypothetical protein
MAINLKEIFEGDSAFIKVEKINYNFDQILANGGGPAGPTGTTGQSGTPGQQGQPGLQGNQGYQGATGNAGVAGDYWDRDEEYYDGSITATTSFHILRPYNLEDTAGQNTTEYISRVVLGDDNAIDSVSETPQIMPNALLTMVNPITGVGTTGEHPGVQIEMFSKGSTNSKYFISTDATTLTLQSQTLGQAANVDFSAQDTFTIRGKDIDIETSTGGNNINLTSVNDTIVNSANDTIVNSAEESHFNGTELSLVYSPAKAHIWSENITMVGEQINIQQNSPPVPHTAETKIFGDAIKIGNTSSYADRSAYQLVAQSVVETVVNDSSEQIGGDKEIDTIGSNKILADINNEIESDVKNKIMSADNEITATSGSNIIQTNNQGNNELKINASINSPGKNILDAGASSNNILRNNGVENFKTQNGLNTSDETIFFSDTDGSHIDSISDGDGVRWKKGNLQLGDPINNYQAVGSHAAPNNPSADKNRTMADYFLKEVLTSPLFKLKKVSGAGNAWTEPNMVGDPDVSSQPSTTNSYLSYVKTGHLINGWYRGKFSTNSNWAVDPQNMNGNTTHFSLTQGGDHLALFLDDNYRFPYKQADGFSNAGAAIFDVIINCGFELQFADFINSGTGGTGNNEDFYGFKGVINQGSNIVWFYKYMRREANSADDKPWLIPLSNNDLAPRNSSGNPTTQSVDINFNFQMWTNTKAYDSVSYGNEYRNSATFPQQCHVEGTLISMADGTKKAVENIKVGDVLSSLDIGMSQDELGYENYLVETKDFSSSSDSSTVKSISSSNFNRHNSINNDMLKITHEHPILVKVAGDVIKWKRTQFVVVGDYILDINGNWVEVTSNVEVNGIVKVWTLDVEDNDTYFADNILVHNAAAESKDDDGDTGDGRVDDVEDVTRDVDPVATFTGPGIAGSATAEAPTGGGANYTADEDDPAATYLWTEGSGGSRGTISDATSRTATVNWNGNYTGGSLTLTTTIGDNTATDTKGIVFAQTTNWNEGPGSGAGTTSYAISVTPEENNDVNVGVVVKVSSTDPAGWSVHDDGGANVNHTTGSRGDTDVTIYNGAAADVIFKNKTTGEEATFSYGKSSGKPNNPG